MGLFFLPSRKILTLPGASESPSIVNWVLTIGIYYIVIWLELLNWFRGLVDPIFKLFFAKRTPIVLRTPSAQFDSLKKVGYDFTPNFVSLNLCGTSLPRMHFLDEGRSDSNLNQDVIVCLHGEPTWSYLYRKMIPVLVTGGYRVIVPDLIGFGKSDKYTSVSHYSYDLHTTSLRLLLEYLNLIGDANRQITLVGHDWGAILGLRLVEDFPDVFHSVVIMNSSLPTGDIACEDLGGDPSKCKKPSGILRSLVDSAPMLLWRSVARTFDTSLPVYGLFRYAEGFSADISKGYAAPFPDTTYAAGPASFPRLIPVFKDDQSATYNLQLRNFLKTWRKPVLVMFGDRDPVCAPYQKMYKNLISQANIITIPGAGHFLPETHGPMLSNNIMKFLE